MTGWERGGVAASKWALLAGVSLATPGALAQAGPATTTAATGGSQVAVNSPNGTSQSGAGDQIEEIVVTAQKRSENLQRVPISIQALSTQKLSELNVTQATDLVKFLPSVAVQNDAPGFTKFYFRGVASGGDGNHSGPLPSVGVYLDEQPVTTILGPPDIHYYDIARIEALAGPQGTLYGASAESGVIRIITNKPDPSKFVAGYDIEGNSVGDHGALGYKAEGFANVPITDRAAIRLVGWYERDAGFIDIVPSTRTFPVSGAVIATNPQRNINQVDTYGGRAALKIDLNDSWTITPTIQAQEQIEGGRFGYNPAVGDLQVRTFYPERSSDFFYQAAATIEGKVHDFDIVYAGSYLHRTEHTQQDYNDYSFFYDTLFGSGNYIRDAGGNLINPSQHVNGNDHFSKESHELRITSPQNLRVRALLGLFYQRQQHNIEQIYQIPGFDPFFSNTGRPGTIWLTEQKRVDKDYAIFGEVAADIIPDHLTLTGGARVFKYDNTLYGYFGYGKNYSPNKYDQNGKLIKFGTGEAACDFSLPVLSGAFCTNLPGAKDPSGDIIFYKPQAKGNGITPRVNLTYKVDKDHLVYGTYSRGFRPGGVNRRGGQAPYLADFLTNFEVGTKNSFLDHKLQINIAAFYENWKNFQFSFLGANGLTEIRNLIGAAHIYGVEGDFTLIPLRGLTLNAAGSYTHATTANDYCGRLAQGVEGGLPKGSIVTQCPGPDQVEGPQAPTGTRLPVTPEFKMNATARYSFTFRDVDLHVQSSVTHQSSSTDDLRTVEAGLLGRLRPYETVDFSFGGQTGRITMEGFVANAFDVRGQQTRFAECAAQVCAAQGQAEPPGVYIVPTRPRTIGIRFGQRF